MKTFADFGIEVGDGRGAEVACGCPQCGPTRKKKNGKPLSANTEKGLFHCNHCGWSGSLLQGEQSKSQSLTFKAQYSKPWYRDCEEERTEELYKWFEDRGIPREIVSRNGITIGSAYMPQSEEYVDCIQFPYLKNGEVVNVKYRGLSEKVFRQHGGAEKVLYGLSGPVDSGGCGASLVIVEGEIDKLSLEVAAIPWAVSVPDGAPSPATKNYTTKFEYLENCKDFLDSFKKVVIAVDNDEPGKRLEEELVRRIGPDRCFIVSWPEGCKDANDVLRQLGAVGLASVIEQARPVPIDGVFEVADLAEEVVDLYEHDQAPGLSTGWPSVDQLYTVKPGELTVVTGIPGHGKSEWLDALFVHLAEEHGWSIGLFSPENFPISNHIAKLVEKYTGKPFRNGMHRRMSQLDLVMALEWAHQHFFFAAHGEGALTLDTIIEKAKGMVKRYGIRGFLIDPWNEIDHARPSDMSETEYVSASLTKIRRFGRHYGVHMWVVAHPQKLYRDKEGGYPVPTMYDISGSANWRNKPDMGIVIWRDVDDADRQTKVYIQKVRNRQNGKLGDASLYWSSASGRYLEQPVKLIGGQEKHQAHNGRTKQTLAEFTSKASAGTGSSVGDHSQN